MSYTSLFCRSSFVVSISNSCNTHLTMICLNILRLSVGEIRVPFRWSPFGASGAGTIASEESSEGMKVSIEIIMLMQMDLPEESATSGLLPSASIRRSSSNSSCGVVVLNNLMNVVTTLSHFEVLSFLTLLSSSCCKQEVPMRANVSFSWVQNISKNITD